MSPRFEPRENPVVADFMGRPLFAHQMYELSSAWRPVGGVHMEQMKQWVVSAQLEEMEQLPDSEEDWERLAEILDQWVRSQAGRAYGADDRGGALWEVHVAALEQRHPEFDKMRAAGVYGDDDVHEPGLAQTLDALADLHPWVGWMSSTNRAHPGDVLPRLAVRAQGVGAHGQQHKPPFVWDKMLRKAGVNPLGEPEEMAPLALEIVLKAVRQR